MADPRMKNLRIKTGVVKRLAHEKVSYEIEADQQRGRIQRFKDEGKCAIQFMLISILAVPQFFPLERFMCLGYSPKSLVEAWA